MDTAKHTTVDQSVWTPNPTRARIFDLLRNNGHSAKSRSSKFQACEIAMPQSAFDQFQAAAFKSFADPKDA